MKSAALVEALAAPPYQGAAEFAKLATDHRAPRDRFEFELGDHLNAADAERALRVAISGGRYAEIFT
jgi:hypothetical protein